MHGAPPRVPTVVTTPTVLSSMPLPELTTYYYGTPVTTVFGTISPVLLTPPTLEVFSTRTLTTLSVVHISFAAPPDIFVVFPTYGAFGSKETFGKSGATPGAMPEMYTPARL